MKPTSQQRILIIGDEPALTYLIGRYARQSGYRITILKSTPSARQVLASRPDAILFPTVDRLEAAQTLIAELANGDIPILVCSSIADEPRARELGADHCLLHPLTFDCFTGALGAARMPGQLSPKPAARSAG